jgi:hypothetical protein
VGSEFHTELRVANSGSGMLTLLGTNTDGSGHPLYHLGAGAELAPDQVEYDGTPARFLWAKKDGGAELSMNLRVHDVTRDALNYGTEIPIVNEGEWKIDSVTLIGVPTDPRFRNTLRIYGIFPFTASVKVGDREPVHVQLTSAPSVQDVPYAIFTDFPSEPGPVRITIEAVPILSPTIAHLETPIWAMVTVTNNETQTISTITPQP